MKQIHNKKSQTQSAVRVFIRVRPLISIQRNTYKAVHVQSDERSIRVHIDQFSDVETKFDKAMDDFKTQKQMFNLLSYDIQQILQGYNMTIFAYGQTGSGKTHTMFGKDWQNNFEDLSKNKKQTTSLTEIQKDLNTAGLIPRCAHELFSQLQQRPQQFNVFGSFLQIYNEKIYDLLNDNERPQSLHIHQSKLDGIFVQGLGEFQVYDFIDILELVRRGQKNRNIRQTSMNAKSSRSHTVFQILIQSIRAKQDGSYIKVKLNLCDLAGSEKMNKKEQMVQGHVEQLKNINLSLTTLGKVIKSLSTGDKKLRASFRESKLTRILQDSLIGNTKTFIIGNVSPSSRNIQETMNTLKFVERARHIKMKVKPTSINSNNAELVRKLQQQLENMRNILIEKSKEKTPQQVNEEVKMLLSENKNLKTTVQKKDEGFDNLMNQNKQMKIAMHRLQLIAMADFSQNHTSETYTSQSQSYRPPPPPPPVQIKEPQKSIFHPQYTRSVIQSRAGSARKQQILPPRYKKNENILPMIQEVQRKQGAIIQEQTEEQIQDNFFLQNNLSQKIKRKGKIDRSSEKKGIIKRLENLESVKRQHEQSIMKDLSIIQKKNKSDELRISRKSQNGSKTERKRGKVDYAQKIRQLQKKLMKRL